MKGGASRLFTLVELLVVVAIIGILVSLLLPSLSAAKDAAKRIQCAGSLKMLVAGSFQYADEYAGWAVPICYGYTTPPSYDEAWYAYTELYKVYGRILKMSESVIALKQGYTKAYICPKASSAFKSSNTFATSPVSHSIGRSYGQNAMVIGCVWGDPILGMKLAKVKSPSMSFHFADATNWRVNKAFSYYSSYYGNPADNGYGEDGTRTQVTAYRHSLSANLGFFDGHVSLLGYRDLQGNSRYWDNN